jgi:signal peptidase I
MRILRIVWIWLQIIGGVVALVAIAWLLMQWVFHLKLLSVQTGSMRPSFVPGDALVLQQTSLAPSVGMVVSYRSSRNPNEVITHRVVRLLPAKNSFQTKGDALTVADPIVRDSLLVGRVTAVLPDMGHVLNWFRSWPGLIVCVYVPVAAVAASELYRLERQYNRLRLYQLYEKQVV